MPEQLQGPYPDAKQVEEQRNTEKVQSWISPALKRQIEAELRPYGGHMSTLIRTLLED